MKRKLINTGALKLFSLCSLLITATACTSIQVSSLRDQKTAMKKVCVLRNPKVLVQDFLPGLQKELDRRSVGSVIYDNEFAPDCQYKVTYTATRGWDVTPYMDYAEIRITKDDQMIGSATYEHAGGFGFNKWASTETKMTPVYKQLFDETSRP